MSVEMWLVRDEAWVVFDTKEMKDIMEAPRSEYEVVYHMADKDFEEFSKVKEEWYKWQRRLAFHLDGK
jgi:hypothetical protein